jgi:hypothetical protein
MARHPSANLVEVQVLSSASPFSWGHSVLDASQPADTERQQTHTGGEHQPHQRGADNSPDEPVRIPASHGTQDRRHDAQPGGVDENPSPPTAVSLVCVHRRNLWQTSAPAPTTNARSGASTFCCARCAGSLLPPASCRLRPGARPTRSRPATISGPVRGRGRRASTSEPPVPRSRRLETADVVRPPAVRFRQRQGEQARSKTDCGDRRAPRSQAGSLAAPPVDARRTVAPRDRARRRGAVPRCAPVS